MKLRTTEIDTDLMPGLRDLIPGEQLIEKAKPLLARIFRSLADEGVHHDAKRKLKISVSLVPEATHDSAQVKLSRLSAEIPGPREPKTSRLVFSEADDGSLRAIPRGDHQPPLETQAPPVTVEGVPELDELFDGDLDEAFRWELAKLLLNLQDPRTERKAPRSIDIEVVFTADETLEVCRYAVTKIKATPAGAKKPEGSVLYMERDGDVLGVHDEAAAILPSDEGPAVGRQATVTNISRRS